jgi:hypothetical protein
MFNQDIFLLLDLSRGNMIVITVIAFQRDTMLLSLSSKRGGTKTIQQRHITAGSVLEQFALSLISGCFLIRFALILFNEGE